MLHRRRAIATLGSESFLIPVLVFVIGASVFGLGVRRYVRTAIDEQATTTAATRTPDVSPADQSVSFSPNDIAPLPPDLARAEPAVADEIRSRRQAVDDNPEDAALWGQLGTTYEVHEYREHARACFSRALELDPTLTRWRYDRAVLTASMGDTSAAEDDLRRVVAEVADYAPAQEGLGLILLERNAFAEARTCFDRVIQLRPEEAAGYVHIAKVAFALERFEEALEVVSQALGIDPKLPEAHYLQGRIFQELGRAKEAEAALARGHNAAPARIVDPWRMLAVRSRVTQSAQHGRALAAMQSGDLDTAARMLEEVLVHKPNDVDVLNNIAIVYLRQGRTSKARRHLQRARTLMPEHTMTYTNLSAVLLRQGKTAEAMRAAQQAVDLAPGNGRARLALALAQARQEQFDAALESFRRAASLDARDPATHTGVGEMLVRLQRSDEAMDAFHRVIALDPTSVRAHYNLGILLIRAERVAEGREVLLEAQRLDPNNQRIRDALLRASKLSGGE